MEKIDDLLKIPEKMSKKTRRLIKASKWKLSIPKIVIISTLEKSRKKDLPISILKTKVSILATKQIDMTIIGKNAYYEAYRL